MQSIRNHRNDRREPQSLDAAMTNQRYAESSAIDGTYVRDDSVLVGDTARRLREANERAFRDAERPWGRGFFARLFSRDKHDG